MSAPDDFTRHLQRLRQDPQAVARAAAAAGQRVTGYVGNDAPVALMLAGGALPVRLRATPGIPDPRIDDFVESSFAPELRAIAAQWLGGALDHLHAVVFSRSDDSGQRLYYYLCELQRRGLCGGPRPLLHDVASLPRESSFEHTVDSTRRLAAQLGATAEALLAALERVRQRDELLRSLQMRRQLPAPLRGSAAAACAFAAGCDWRASFDAAAHAWLEAEPLLPMPRRLLLAGDAPPDQQLHEAIEAAGASLILELTESTAGSEPDIRDPIAAIATDCQRRESPALAMQRDARWLADRARDQRADAVLVWLSEQNEALPWEIPRQVRALRAAGIPVLVLQRQPWSISAAVLTQVMHLARTPGEFR